MNVDRLLTVFIEDNGWQCQLMTPREMSGLSARGRIETSFRVWTCAESLNVALLAVPRRAVRWNYIYFKDTDLWVVQILNTDEDVLRRRETRVNLEDPMCFDIIKHLIGEKTFEADQNGKLAKIAGKA